MGEGKYDSDGASLMLKYLYLPRESKKNSNEVFGPVITGNNSNRLSTVVVGNCSRTSNTYTASIRW